MKPKLLISILIVFLTSTGLEAAEEILAQDPGSTSSAQHPKDGDGNQVVDTEGLIDASHSLARSIEQLSTSIERLATNSETLSAEDRAALVSAVKSADQASQAVTRLADQLPQIVSNSLEPVAEVSTGFDVTITESLLVKLSVYTLILLIALAVVIITVMWFVYKRYMNPLAKKLDALADAPEHLENMSRHMEQTSSNLLALQGESANSSRASQLRSR